MKLRASCSGFTLIELLVAVALMSVLAVLGWRGLDSVLTGRERIVESSDGLRALSVAFTQLEDDLRRAWPARLLGPGVPAIAFVEDDASELPALSLLRELPPDSGAAQLQRVVWRLRAGVLERAFGAFAMSGVEGQVQAAALTWQPLLHGVTAWHLRAWIPGRGWIAQAALVQRAGTQIDLGEITGVEVSLERGGERVLRIFTVKD